MAKSQNVSASVIKRLPRYYRFLGDLQGKGVVRISSRELSEIMGLTASQIRQDLNCFGEFGQQGYGYNVEQLHGEIGEILGLNRRQKIILVGAGNLGRAVATHMNFESRGFQLVGVFDSKEAMTGQLVRDLPVHHIDRLDEFCRANLPTAAILCVPKLAAPELAEQLVRLGVRGFWNFSHDDLSIRYPSLPIENVHLGDSLMTFCYRLNAYLRENGRKTSVVKGQ